MDSGGKERQRESERVYCLERKTDREREYTVKKERQERQREVGMKSFCCLVKCFMTTRPL